MLNAVKNVAKSKKKAWVKMPWATEFAHSTTLNHMNLEKEEDFLRNKETVAGIFSDIATKWINGYGGFARNKNHTSENGFQNWGRFRHLIWKL